MFALFNPNVLRIGMRPSIEGLINHQVQSGTQVADRTSARNKLAAVHAESCAVGHFARFKMNGQASVFRVMTRERRCNAITDRQRFEQRSGPAGDGPVGDVDHQVVRVRQRHGVTAVLPGAAVHGPLRARADRGAGHQHYPNRRQRRHNTGRVRKRHASANGCRVAPSLLPIFLHMAQGVIFNLTPQPRVDGRIRQSARQVVSAGADHGRRRAPAGPVVKSVIGREPFFRAA